MGGTVQNNKSSHTSISLSNLGCKFSDCIIVLCACAFPCQELNLKRTFHAVGFTLNLIISSSTWNYCEKMVVRSCHFNFHKVTLSFPLNLEFNFLVWQGVLAYLHAACFDVFADYTVASRLNLQLLQLFVGIIKSSCYVWKQCYFRVRKAIWIGLKLGNRSRCIELRRCDFNVKATGGHSQDQWKNYLFVFSIRDRVVRDKTMKHKIINIALILEFHFTHADKFNS